MADKEVVPEQLRAEFKQACYGLANSYRDLADNIYAETFDAFVLDSLVFRSRHEHFRRVLEKVKARLRTTQ